MDTNPQQPDSYSPYETGLRTLLAQLGRDHPRYAEALTYQQRLLENIAGARRYGDQELRRAERAEIVDRLNELAAATGDRTFNELCGPPAALAGPLYDDEATYRARLADRHRKLDFIGIPELKEHPPITIEDIFITLRAEPEVDHAHAAAEILAPQRSPGPPDSQPAAPDAGLLVRAGAPVALNQALREANHLAVLGDPGSGKTTLLKYLTVICAEERAAELGLPDDRAGPRLPIFVPLQQFAVTTARRRQDYSLLDFFYTYADERLLLKLAPGFFEAALRAGRCLVCLDGLDEVWAVGQRAEVRDAVAALAARFPANAYIVTSRIVGYQEAPLDRRDFAHHTVLPLSNADIHQFVGKWYGQRERDPVERRRLAVDLIDTIEQEPHIQSLARNPLLLTIIALVHRAEAELPRRRVQLYGKCVTTLVETREKVKGLAIEERHLLSYSEQRQLLERLAYTLHTRAEQTGLAELVLEGELELLLTNFLIEEELTDHRGAARDKARAFIELTKSRAGLLIERGAGEFDFAHPTFREYLAASDIVTRNILGGVEAIWSEIAPRLHVAHWREALLLLLGLLNRYKRFATALVERVLDAGERDLFEPTLHRHLFLAARIMADRVEISLTLRRRIVEALLEIARAGPWWEREDALAALSELTGDAYAAERLLALARDTTAPAGVRRGAAVALAAIGWAADARRVLRALGRDQQVPATVRYGVAQALERLGQPKEAVTVLRALGHDEHVEPTVRRFAAEMLTRMGRVNDAEAISIIPAVRRAIVRIPMSRARLANLASRARLADLPAEELLVLARDPHQNQTIRYDAYRRLKGLLGGGSG